VVGLTSARSSSCQKIAGTPTAALRALIELEQMRSIETLSILKTSKPSISVRGPGRAGSNSFGHLQKTHKARKNTGDEIAVSISLANRGLAPVPTVVSYALEAVSSLASGGTAGRDEERLEKTCWR
jgi:hypothetical protein